MQVPELHLPMQTRDTSPPMQKEMSVELVIKFTDILTFINMECEGKAIPDICHPLEVALARYV